MLCVCVPLYILPLGQYGNRNTVVQSRKDLTEPSAQHGYKKYYCIKWKISKLLPLQIIILKEILNFYIANSMPNEIVRYVVFSAVMDKHVKVIFKI